MLFISAKKRLLKYLSKHDGGYDNRHAMRWLYTREPDLWNDILSVTSFLPNDAKPKQRAFHILNDLTEIPVCPETGREVRWLENKYLKYDTRSAKGKHHHKAGVYTWHGEEARAKAKDSINEGIGNGSISFDRNYCSGEKMAEAVRNGWKKKHGVDNIMEIPEMRRKVGVNQPGATPHHLRPLKKIYYSVVSYYTEKSWREYQRVISPDGHNRKHPWALDHIYSRQQGFLDGIPPYIIGHWTNLQMLTVNENLAKSMRCDKTVDALFEDYFNKR